MFKPPILAIDYGVRHIGLAVSDFKGKMATPLPALHRTKNRAHEQLIDEIVQISHTYEAKSILIGLPQAFVTNHEKIRIKIESFKEKLSLKTDLPITFWDESFSTSSARNMLLSMGYNSKEAKNKIDSASASYFLQQFLDENGSPTKTEEFSG